MRSLLPIYLAFLFVLFLPGKARAQLYTKMGVLSSQDGLSDERVTCFLKDRDGYIWVGTRNGLNRYDGHRFTIFRPQQDNSISNEAINDIIQDKNGIIWVATMGGLNRYDPASERWEKFTPEAHDGRNDLPNFIVWDIELAGDGKIWIACDVFEFSLFDPVKKKFRYYDWPGFARAEPGLSPFSYRSIQRFVPRNTHQFWLATTNGLAVLDTVTRAFRFLGGGYNEDVIDLRYDEAAGKVFITIADGGVFVYDEKKASFTKASISYEPYPSRYFARHGKSEMWMGAREGLLRVSDDRTRFYLSRSVPGLQGALLPGGVNRVYADPAGITWIGTNNGINKFIESYKTVSFLPLMPLSEAGENRVNSVLFDPVQQAYFASTGTLKKIFVIDAVSGAITAIQKDARGRPLPASNALFSDHHQNIWLLTVAGVYRYDRPGKQFVPFPIARTNPEPNFRDMTEDAAGNYWFASFDAGLFSYRTNGKNATPEISGLPGTLKKLTSVLADTLHGRLWIGTFSSGLYCYEFATKKITGYHETDSTEHYAPLALIHDIAQDASGQVWVATHSGGVFRQQEGVPYGSAFTQFTMREGLSSNNYLSIAAGSDTTLWLLSGQGISAISQSGRLLFDLKDKAAFPIPSFASEDLGPHFISFSQDQKELLAGASGGILFVSSAPPGSAQNYPVRISSVAIGERPLPDSLASTFSYVDIPFRYNAIAFSFVALNFAQTAPMTYEYKLEGYDVRWIYAGTNQDVKYPNLPAGKYVFQVRAKDEQGNLSAATARFAFRIAPPFWRTATFLAFAFLIAASFIYFWISSLRRRIKEEKILNYFATSLYGQNTVDDVFWDIAKNCISQLRFEDCVIYLYDEKRKMLIQKAAHGDKNPHTKMILNPIEIPLGKGIVGSVAASLKPEIIHNTSRDSRYIVDDRKRSSEISVPILVEGKLFGVIDSEHSRRRFFTGRHLTLLQKIATTCSIKLTRYLVEEKLRVKIARDLHDEMGSTLTSINIISKVAMQQPGDQPAIRSQLAKIKDHSSRMMESMSDMVWAIDPSNDSFEKIMLRMKEFAGEILEPAGINYFFRESEGLEDIQLNPGQRKDIYLIFKEALNNAVKYSGATEIFIQFRKDESSISMQVIDNGRGFDPANRRQGNGLRNMEARAAALDAQFRVDSIPGTGTTVFLQMPIP